MDTWKTTLGHRLAPPWRARHVLLLLSALLLFALSSCSDTRAPLSNAAPSSAGASPQAALAEYAFVRAPSALQAQVRAHNRRHGLQADLDGHGVVRISRTSQRDWVATLELRAVGRRAELRPAPAVSTGPALEHVRARYRRGDALEEWYANGPDGLEQGFVLARPPARGATDAPVVLDVHVAGSLRPEPSDRAGTVALKDHAGVTVLRYGVLFAHDAAGRELPSEMSVEGSSILLAVDDRGAAYPVTIDPLVWVQDQKILPASPGAAADQLGYAVALSGDTAVVGANSNDEEGIDAGAAYVFVRSGATWVHQQKLTASDAHPSDRFGYAVAIDGDVAVVGAYGDDEKGIDAGAAYVFIRTGTTWTEQKKLVPAAGEKDDYFGISVAVSGDTAIVGAYGDDDTGSMGGAVYVFGKDQGGADNWGEVTKLVSGDGAPQDDFGIAVALDADTALIGARGHDDMGSMSGAAYVFVRTGGTWSQQQKLTAGDGVALDYFGAAVAISGDTIAVGAHLANVTTTADSGAAYVFVRSGATWTEQQKLVSGDPGVQDYFGVSLALSGDTLLVGAWGDDEKATDAGAVYFFSRSGTTWAQQKKVFAGDGAGSDSLGTSVALDGTTALVGVPSDDDGGTNSGSAWLLGRDQGGADNWGEVSKVRAFDGMASEDCGFSVALSGDTIVAGAYGADDHGAETGAAYVFVRSGTAWAEQARLVASDAAAGDRFGFTVSLSGDTAVVGAYLHDDTAGDSGAAYVFVRTGTTWTEQAKLVAPDAVASDNFGVAVAVDGDTVLVGAHADDDKGSASGSVYVFVRTGTTWAQQQKLVAADGVANDNFGRSLAVKGDTAIVGSPNDDDTASNSGSAYVFVRSGTAWTQQQKLVAGDPGASDSFGWVVAVSGNTALVGSYLDDANATDTDTGSAYVFVRGGTTWTQQQKLVASDALKADRFGGAVGIEGDMALVGTYYSDAKGSNSGAAYVFLRAGTSWTEHTKLVGADGAANDYFGYGVAFSGTTAVAGAYGDDDKGSASGSVYAFELKKTDGTGCSDAGECQSGSCVNAVCCVLPACPDCHSCALVGSLGQCTADPAAQGAGCGDHASTDCSDPDTCDGTGVCQPNHHAAGASCGDPKADACTAADTCDGVGTCLPNDSPAGTSCKDTSATDCTKPDTCNGSGVCLSNDEPDGTACHDGQCTAGVCVGEGGAGGGGQGGQGGQTGQGGQGGQGQGGQPPAGGGGTGGSQSKDTGGCGCRTAGAPADAGLLSGLLLATAMASLRRRKQGAVVRPFVVRRAAPLPAGLVAAGMIALSCGGSGTNPGTSTTTGHGGAASSTHSAGAGGSTECPSELQCGFVCCQPDQECVNLQCLPLCPAPQQRCGDNLEVCCGVDQECYEGVCAPRCGPQQVHCGDDHVCCADDEVCANASCTAPGAPCVDFADCKDTEYCEPTLGVCLSSATLPDCKYHPPVGLFSPIKEWTYSPLTAPYVRSSSAQSPADICSGGIPLAFPDADESVVVVPLGGLVIPFFDQDRSAMKVSTNGWLTLDGAYQGGALPDNTALPNSSGPSLMVAPYWDDLTNVTACVNLDKTKARVVVQWHGEVKGTGEWITVQAIMNGDTSAEAGVVELAYLELGAMQDGDGATVGIAEAVTRRAVQHGYNRNGAVSTGQDLRFRYVPLHNRFDALAAPAVFDLDGDGKPEVIFVAYDDTPVAYSTMPNDPINDMHSGVLTILNGEDGTIQARPLETPGYDGYLGAGAALSVGDIDLDGQVEIVGVGTLEPMIADAPSYVKAFKPDGTLLWVSNATVGFTYNGWGGGVHLADLDQDGFPEIFFGLSVFNHEGILIWSKAVEYGSPTTTAADLDGDGYLEIVSDHSAWRWDSKPLWGRPDLGAYHFPAVADFNGDGKPEVALVSDGSVIVLRGDDGTTFWGPISLQTNGGGPLNIGDFDGDGKPEMGTAGEGAYLVLDLQCTGTPLPAGCDREGVRWAVPTKDISSNVTGSSLFDFEGDGKAEVVYSDECFTRVYSGLDGQVLSETPVNTRTATEYPLVADVDGDNNAEVIVVANESVTSCQVAPWNMGFLGTPWVEADYPPPFCSSAVTCGYRGLTVYGDALDNWVRTRAVWSGHAYHITNVLANGTIPAKEDPNWLKYNNFRMNAQGAGLFAAPDLMVALEADPLPCPAKLRLRARVSNIGALGVAPGVNVAFHKKGPGGWQCLGVADTSKDLLPGDKTEVTFDYVLATGEIGDALDFRAVVDADCDGNGVHNECEGTGEANNESTASGTCTDTGPR